MDNLNGVGCRAFSDVVRDAPKVYAAVHAFVDADTSDKDFVVVFSHNGHGVNVVGDVVLNDDSGEVFKAREHRFFGAGFLELDVDGLAVSVEHGNAYGGSRNAQSLVVQDFFGFLDHLPFLFGVTVFEENVDVREHIVSDGVGELLGSFARDTVFEVVSLNEDVIPAEAISGVKGSTPDVGNVYFFQGSFKIDRTQIKEGTTTLVFFDNDNERVISKTVTVVPFGDVYKEEAWTVSVTADLSDVSSEYLKGNLRLFFVEGDDTYVYGSVYPSTIQRFDFTSADLTDGKITAQYYYVFGEGKKYTVWVAYEKEVNGITAFYPLGNKSMAMFSSDGGTFPITATDPAE